MHYHTWAGLELEENQAYLVIVDMLEFRAILGSDLYSKKYEF